MKKIKKSMLYALLLLVVVMFIPTQASAAAKINKKSVTLIKGQTVTLKITGTKNKVSWSSNKKSVASVSEKGKVTAKKKGSAKITAKVGKKTFSCKVKVEVPKINKTSLSLQKGTTEQLKISGTSQKIKWKSSNKKIATVNSEGLVKGTGTGTCKITATVGGKNYTCTVTVKAGGAQYKSYAIDQGVIVLIRNNYDYTISVDMDCIFYNSGTMVTKGSDAEYALESGRECALFAYDFSTDWDDYKINIKVEKENNIIGNAKNIKVTSNFGNENVMATIKNSGQRVNFTRIAILFFLNGNVIGYDEAYADVNNPGETDYIEFSFPYEYELYPDSYQIYVNSSYRYNWS